MNPKLVRPVKRRPLKLFFCYSHENADVREALDRHLDILEREGLVITWYDGAIVPGSQWPHAIDENIILAGNLNIGSADSPAVQAFRNQGFVVPSEHIHPTSAFRADGYYDLIGSLVNKSAQTHARGLVAKDQQKISINICSEEIQFAAIYIAVSYLLIFGNDP